MKRYLVRGAEFFLIEEKGAVVSLMRGFSGGMAIKRKNPIGPFLMRKIFVAMQKRRHAKEGFVRAERGYDPRTRNTVDLNDYMLPGGRYFEHDDSASFFEISLRGSVLKKREGRIGGLGKILSIAEGGEPGDLERKMESLIEEMKAKGYKELYAGPSFSLRVVEGELPGD
jgi:hypothetical protein